MEYKWAEFLTGGFASPVIRIDNNDVVYKNEVGSYSYLIEDLCICDEEERLWQQDYAYWYSNTRTTTTKIKSLFIVLIVNHLPIKFLIFATNVFKI